MGDKKKYDLKIFTDLIEPEASNQIYRLMAQPAFSDCKVRIMPDVHAGAGCVIGFTADLGDKVIPNIVGVDIGCGMLTVMIHRDSNVDLEKLDEVIHNHIPSGFDIHDRPYMQYPYIKNLYCYDQLKNRDRFEQSICTLGGGNHFIEVDEHPNGTKFLVIHTGSRNLGKQVAEYYQKVALDQFYNKDIQKQRQNALIESLTTAGLQRLIQYEVQKLKSEFNASGALNIPKDLCYLEGDLRKHYLHDMGICQDYAKTNRFQIAKEIFDKMQWGSLALGFETIHNYIDIESNIVRKGAVSAKDGERLLIPINMRDGCLLCRGKGNPDWNYSAPHGAGRLMSRKKAKETLSLEDYKDSMAGIHTTSVGADTIDEAPMAYKPIESILDNIKDTVEVEAILKPIYNFKASESNDQRKGID